MDTELTYEKVLALIKGESEERIKGQKTFEKKLKENQKAFEKELKERRKAFEKELKERNEFIDNEYKNLRESIKDLTNAWSNFSEEIVKPRILELFEDRGIELTELHPHVKVKKEGKTITEIDFLLINSNYSVAVEVKSNLKHKHIKDHVKRMELLQRNPLRGTRGTKLIGAVAGMIVSESVETAAQNEGFYVIKQKGDTVEITNKPGYKPKEWNIA